MLKLRTGQQFVDKKHVAEARNHISETRSDIAEMRSHIEACIKQSGRMNINLYIQAICTTIIACRVKGFAFRQKHKVFEDRFGAKQESTLMNIGQCEAVQTSPGQATTSLFYSQQ
jgi:hypothetical protein